MPAVAAMHTATETANGDDEDISIILSLSIGLQCECVVGLAQNAINGAHRYRIS
jgi:hypothetical protein